MLFNGRQYDAICDDKQLNLATTNLPKNIIGEQNLSIVSQICIFLSPVYTQLYLQKININDSRLGKVMGKIKIIGMMLAFFLCAMNTVAQEDSTAAMATASSSSVMQAEIDHLYFYIGGARRCQLLTASGMQSGMKTIVDFKRLHGLQAEKINSAEEFIAMVAANNGITGKLNIVECRKSGEKLKTPMNEWLQAELANYRVVK